MQLSGQFEIDAPRALVFERITEPGLMAECIPGCDSIEQIDPHRYRAIVSVGLGAVKAHFDLMVEVTGENAPVEVLSRTTGVEGGRASSLTADNRVWLTELDSGGTQVNYESEVTIAGRLGKFGLGVMRKYVEKMGNRFAENFRAAILEGGKAPATPSAAESKQPASSDAAAKADSPAADSSPDARAQASQNSAVLFPASIEEAVAMLEREPGSFPLAGGATLIAMKNAGLVSVARYVSLERIESLQGINVASDGTIRIGAMTRHRETASSDTLTGNLEVVRQAAASIANMPVRNMGTMGGALAHADPAADYLGALTAVDAKIEVAGPGGRRTIAVQDWITDWYETSLGANEIVVAIHLPAAAQGHSSYRKVARVSGDYSVANCAISVDLEGQKIRVAIGACGPAPLRDSAVEPGLDADPQSIETLGQRLVAMADPVDDVRGSADYRLKLIPRLVADAVAGIAGSEVT